MSQGRIVPIDPMQSGYARELPHIALDHRALGTYGLCRDLRVERAHWNYIGLRYGENFLSQAAHSLPNQNICFGRSS